MTSARADWAMLREKIDLLIAADEVQSAARCLAEFWREENGPAAAGFVVARYEQLRPHLALLPYRLAILRSFTVEPLVPLLRAASFVHGIDLTIRVGAFGAYAPEILMPDGPLYRFGADAVILAVQTRDLAPDLWRDYADLNRGQRNASVARAVQTFRDLVAAFRAHSHAHLIIHTLEEPLVPSLGILDGQSESSQATAVQQINQGLRRVALGRSGVYILDYDALVARHGRARWHDRGMWLTARLPIAAAQLAYLPNEWLRFLHPLVGKVAKALIVDLDNTLWGGIVGEDGPAGIQLGPDYPGAGYQALQRALLDLHRRGILLAVCSKNNPEDVMEVLEHHPGMVLRPEHFACMRINWRDKVDNLRDIAEELNIGIEALAFLDEDPMERQRVRGELPDVTVIELPDNPLGYADALRDSPVFERLTVSAEDRQRGAHYVDQRKRVELERSYPSREDFLRNLQQEAEIIPVSPETFARVAQLTQKTNQLNLTTRRYTAQELADVVTRADWRARALRARDRHGDSGLVGVAIVHTSGKICQIDSLLLSCRVIGRTLETAFLSYLVELARAQGALQLQGWFVPTAKNTPAADLYPHHGFSLLSQDEGGSLWGLDLSRRVVACPEWIRLTVPDDRR
jgi:FkbH-like protein